MDRSPPRNQRLRRPVNGSTAGSSAGGAFYVKPSENIKTPAEIVSEAKEELLRQTRDKVRVVQTTRPFTPRDDQRTLFGHTANNYADRPASAFSLGSQHFDGNESRPVSGSNRPPSGSMRPPSGSIRPPSGSVRLAPIDDAAYEGVVPKPPSGDPKKRRSARRLRPQASVETDQSISTPRSGSCGDLKGQDAEVVGSRRVHSGPKERTSPHDDQPASVNSSRSGSGGIVRSSSGGTSRTGSGGSRTAPQVEVIRRASEVISIEERGEGDGQEVPSPVRSKANHGTKDTKDISDKDQEYVETILQPLIDRLRQHNVEDSTISHTCDEIYEILDSAHLLGKASGKRSSILKSIFKLMDRSSAKVLLSLARLTLALRVSGSNLNSVCKLVFKVSREKSNDQLFVNSNVLDLLFDTMVNMDHDQTGDALVYCCGAVKFLAGNKSLSDTLSRKCTLYTLASILNKINKQSIECNRVNEKHVQVLVQLTSALRRFAELDIFTSQFIAHSIIDELCVTSIAFSSEYELMLNVSSAFSKLTIQLSGCEALSKHPSCYKSLLKLLSTYTHKEDLVSRICFVLGNLAALDEESRLALYQENNSIVNLMSVFEHYLQLSFKHTSEGSSSSRQAVNEVLIKLIRVIANLSISEDVGASLCDNKKCVEYLLHIIDVKEISEQEELVLNAMATINNLSFYSSTGTAIEDNEVETSRCLMKMLLKDHKEGLLEACRIYGNLTRSRLVRDFLTANSVLEIMVTLLDSGEQELVYSCCGVLVNFMCDEDKRPVLKRENGLAKLIEVLNDFAIIDWQLAGLVCQVLWNYSTNIRSSNSTFGESESQNLTTLLTDFIDDPHIPKDDSCSKEMRHYLKETWRSEFCSVAAQLRKRVKSHQSKFVELSPPKGES